MSSSWNKMNNAELVSLTEKASMKNKILDVSGVLLYHDMHFLQVLEGSEPLLNKLYELIQNDKRHYGFITLYDGKIKTRNFQNWGMALVNVDNLKTENVELFKTIENATPWETPQTTMNFRVDNLINAFKQAVGY
jgi:hypothetical protein